MEDYPDSLMIENMLSKIGSNQTDMERKVIHRLLWMKEILPPEQKDRFLDLITKSVRQFNPFPPERPGPGRKRFRTDKHIKRKEKNQ